MYLIVVGAGRTGSRIVEMATRDGHEVVVIEEDQALAQDVSRDHDCLVVNDDGSSREVLAEAEVRAADALVATTDDDATNLLVMMHGRDAGVPSLVSSMNDEENTRLFQELGVNVVESPHRLNGEYLYRAVQRPAIQDFMTIGDGAEVFEITVSRGAPITEFNLDEADRHGLLDDDTIVVAIQRDGEVLIPRGGTDLEPGDLVTVFSLRGASARTTDPFAGGEG